MRRPRRHGRSRGGTAQRGNMMAAQSPPPCAPSENSAAALPSHATHRTAAQRAQSYNGVRRLLLYKTALAGSQHTHTHIFYETRQGKRMEFIYHQVVRKYIIVHRVFQLSTISLGWLMEIVIMILKKTIYCTAIQIPQLNKIIYYYTTMNHFSEKNISSCISFSYQWKYI